MLREAGKDSRYGVCCTVTMPSRTISLCLWVGGGTPDVSKAYGRPTAAAAGVGKASKARRSVTVHIALLWWAWQTLPSFVVWQLHSHIVCCHPLVAAVQQCAVLCHACHAEPINGVLCCAALRRLTGVEAMSKVVQAWGQGALYPDIAPALSKINNAGIKVCAESACCCPDYFWMDYSS
jgi:hypothetical protein